MTRAARAIAHPNFALAKYWGKLDARHNLPAVPSLSITLDAMTTTTEVRFDPGLEVDVVRVAGAVASVPFAARVVALLDRVRAEAGLGDRASVDTVNDFPTASGLASSASGFAALAVAATTAAGLGWSAARVSDLARRSSASAARSVFGGFAVLPAGRAGEPYLPAEPLAGEGHWPLAVAVAVTSEQEKATGSTDGMRHTADTSPYYAAWIADAPATFARVRAAVLARDLEALTAAAEASAFAMHACALAARPALVYWNPGTLAALACVRELRRAGTLAFATVDAGPHVKAIAEARDAERVAAALAAVPGVLRVLRAGPGPGASATPLVAPR